MKLKTPIVENSAFKWFASNQASRHCLTGTGTLPCPGYVLFFSIIMNPLSPHKISLSNLSNTVMADS